MNKAGVTDIFFNLVAGDRLYLKQIVWLVTYTDASENLITGNL
jgi:hypothetical protein